MYCKYLKQKLNKKLYCNKLKKEINISNCTRCKYKEYSIKSNVAKLKKRTSRQTKLERNRFSILTNDLDHCIICGDKKDHLHEVFFGRNRTNSIKYGLVIFEKFARFCLCPLKSRHIKTKNIDIPLLFSYYFYINM